MQKDSENIYEYLSNTGVMQEADYTTLKKMYETGYLAASTNIRKKGADEWLELSAAIVTAGNPVNQEEDQEIRLHNVLNAFAYTALVAGVISFFCNA